MSETDNSSEKESKITTTTPDQSAEQPVQVTHNGDIHSHSNRNGDKHDDKSLDSSKFSETDKTIAEKTTNKSINNDANNEDFDTLLAPPHTSQGQDDLASLNSTEAILDTDKEKLNDLTNNNLHDMEEGIPVNDTQETIDSSLTATTDPESTAATTGTSPIPKGPTEQELNPTLARFMEACQKGELSEVTQLIESGQVKANDTFSDTVSGLHWASINNRLTVVKYLTQNEVSKADPNLLGGDLKASPLHWACRNGLVYIVDYLLSNTDADPTIRDAQSYNSLHLAVHSSNIMLVIYLLLSYCGGSANNNDASKKNLHVDEVDGSSRTSLHWAAYQGDLLTVNVLLKFGADINKVDNSLFIPLHWAFIKGYKSVLKSLVEAGSDIFAKNDQGKNSFAVAKDMNCITTWVNVLLETGRSPKRQWTIKQHFLSPKYGKLITFFFPYWVLPLVFQICSFSQGYVIPKLFVSFIIFGGSIMFLIKYIIPTYLLEEKSLFKSPFLAGIFSATAFWAIAVWVFRLLPTLIFKRFFTNVALAGTIALFIWAFFKAMFINPGFVPTPSDNSIILEQAKELIKLGKFDTDNFCVNTLIRKPLRSKYSRHNKKLVARFDHYCPWVYNEVGVRNHKLFMTFVYSLALAVLLFSSLSFKFFDLLEDNMDGYASDDESQKCSILSDELCVGYKTQHFHFNLMIWSLIQFTWIIFLCVVQTFQICKGLTTWEFSLLNNEIRNTGLNHSTLPRDFNGNLQPSIATPNSSHKHGFNSSMGMCTKLIGLDQFILTVKLSVLSLFSKTSRNDSYTSLNNVDIPTDYGLKQNWNDFWFLGDVEWRNMFYLPIEGENNLNGQIVDYYKLYELPPKVSGSAAV